MYEYVFKSEYKEPRANLIKVIEDVRSNLKVKYTFQQRLIGSAGNFLITRNKKSNKEFDFDYNLVIQKIKTNVDNPKEIIEDFYKSFEKFSNKYNYKITRSKTVITLKFLNKNNKLLYSADFALLKDKITHEEVVVRNGNVYVWNIDHNTEGYKKKLKTLRKNKKWNDIRNEYLKLKNSNKDLKKKSYHLYIEAINNVYNK